MLLISQPYLNVLFGKLPQRFQTAQLALGNVLPCAVFPPELASPIGMSGKLRTHSLPRTTSVSGDANVICRFRQCR